MTPFQTILYDKRDAVAFITLNRPAAVNAFNVQMRDDLSEALGAVRDDPDVRGLLIAGAGDKGFCAGADLTEFGTAPSQTIARSVRWERDLWSALARLPVPVIAAVHGHCIGSGVEIAALCDLRIAAHDAVFTMPETALGLIPAAGGTQTLPRIIGESSAAALILAGERLNARDALQRGLVHWSVPRDQLLAEAERRLRSVIEAPPQVLTLVKRAVREGQDLPMHDALLLERRLAARLA